MKRRSFCINVDVWAPHSGDGNQKSLLNPGRLCVPKARGKERKHTRRRGLRSNQKRTPREHDGCDAAQHNTPPAYQANHTTTTTPHRRTKPATARHNTTPAYQADTKHNTAQKNNFHRFLSCSNCALHGGHFNQRHVCVCAGGGGCKKITPLAEHRISGHCCWGHDPETSVSQNLRC